MDQDDDTYKQTNNTVIYANCKIIYILLKKLKNR